MNKSGGRAVDVAHMAFSKAFDMVAHGRLVWKDVSHGIQCEKVNRIQNWPKGSCGGLIF